MKIDLHTHSSASPDGGITAKQYARLLEHGKLDVVAVTDHNNIEFAVQLQKELGEDKIIVGEEIMTTKGEIIGLFLTKVVKPGQSPLQTAQAIKAQGGLVYIPHPFETVRKGLQQEDLDAIAKDVDIIEAYNGRAILQNRTNRSIIWAQTHGKPIFASSDAHGPRGIGHTYTTSAKKLLPTNAASVLAEAHIVVARPPIGSLAYPKYHRLRKKIRRKT